MFKKLHHIFLRSNLSTLANLLLACGRPAETCDRAGRQNNCDVCLLFITAQSSLFQRHLIRNTHAAPGMRIATYGKN